MAVLCFTMHLVDVHAHLDLYPAEEQEAVIANCKKNSITVIANGVTPESNRKVLEFAKQHSFIKPALGIYPTHCVDYSEEQFTAELDFIEKEKPIAIGEVGMDYKEIIEPSQRAKMKKCFEEFITISKKLNIPIIVHSRKAELETVEILETFDHKKIVMHCFSGRKHHIQKVIDHGWMFSIPCNVIKLQQFQEIVKEQDISRLLTETDSPYLTPYPDKKNEPSFVIESLKKIAEIKKLDTEETANIIYQNYQRLFL
jgi:TatD DNase family protein